MTRTRSFRLGLAAALALAALAACRRSTDALPGQRVESPDLGIAVAALPQPFRVEKNDEEGLVLLAPGPEGPGEATIRVEAPDQPGGINLVALVKQRKAAFEALPEGSYLGNQELATPNGSAFTARGRFRGDDGALHEEIWVYALDPADPQRLLTIDFTYPPGNSQQRAQDLLKLVAEIEPIGGEAPATPPATTASGSATG